MVSEHTYSVMVYVNLHHCKLLTPGHKASYKIGYLIYPATWLIQFGKPQIGSMDGNCNTEIMLIKLVMEMFIIHIHMTSKFVTWQERDVYLSSHNELMISGHHLPQEHCSVCCLCFSITVSKAKVSNFFCVCVFMLASYHLNVPISKNNVTVQAEVLEFFL